MKLLIAVLVLSACTIEVQAPTTTMTVPTTTTTTRPTTTTTARATTEAANVEDTFLSVLRDHSDGLPFNWSDVMNDEDMLAMALVFCGGLDSGLTWEELSGAYFDGYGKAEDADLEMFGWFMGAAVTAFCPEYESVFDE